MAEHSDANSPLELEPASRPVESKPDHRRRVPEPLPVRLTAIEDVHLPAPAGVEVQLDRFYAELLEFERLAGELTYRAENLDLRFNVTEPPVIHDSLRPVGIEVESLAEAEKKFIEAEIEYLRQRGTMPGSSTLLVLDPAGNWVEISENRLIR